jgi:hypothetical protein
MDSRSSSSAAAHELEELVMLQSVSSRDEVGNCLTTAFASTLSAVSTSPCDRMEDCPPLLVQILDDNDSSRCSNSSAAQGGERQKIAKNEPQLRLLNAPMLPQSLDDREANPWRNLRPRPAIKRDNSWSSLAFDLNSVLNMASNDDDDAYATAIFPVPRPAVSSTTAPFASNLQLPTLDPEESASPLRFPMKKRPRQQSLLLALQMASPEDLIHLGR